MISLVHKNVAALLIAMLTVSLATGCSKESPKPDVSVPRVAKTTAKDFGEILFVDNEPNIEDLGDGKTVIFTPTVLPDGNLQISIVIEQRDATGNKTVLSKAGVRTPSNGPVEIAIGDVGIKFTPKLKGK